MTFEPDVTFAADASTLADARRLILEYVASLPFRFDCRHFDDKEMKRYAPPTGALLVAYVDKAAAGVVGLRPLAQPAACEMKRLYVPPRFRGLGIGVKLATAVIGEARTLGYRRMRLDTHAGTMGKAIALYRSLGFVQIEPPRDAVVDPPPDIAAELIFMELALE